MRQSEEDKILVIMDGMALPYPALATFERQNMFFP